MNNYVFFDIGANWGEDSLNRCNNDADVEVYAFEPTPQLVNHLLNISRSFQNRYHVVPLAVSDFDGLADFYIQNNPGMGCNSLNTFDAEAIEKYWLSLEGHPRLEELSSSNSVQVNVCRLDTWIKNNIPTLEKIDYFHCDTQGTDLKVLQGMGDYIHLIQQGKVECARDQEIKLYHESNNFVEDVCDYLDSKGFEILNIESNDHLANELNVYFKKL
jgi:hypothetical protein